jgi:hypothetical protein
MTCIRYKYVVTVICVFVAIDMRSVPPGCILPFMDVPLVLNLATHKLFVGANKPVAGVPGNMALSFADNASQKFTGITPPIVMCSGIEHVANPLYGAKINYLARAGDMPVAVILGKPQQVYVVNSYENQDAVSVLVGTPNDAHGLKTSEIEAIVGTDQGTVFVAVAPHYDAPHYDAPHYEGDFGAPGSGIALGKIGEHRLTFLPAVPLTVASSAVRVGAASAALLETPILYFDKILYVGYQVIAGATGARSIVVGKPTTHAVLDIMPLAPDAAITADVIIGSNEAGAVVDAYAINTMHTTTNLSYLIVVGGVTSRGATPTSVFALPLTSQGLLAAKNAPVVIGRGFVMAAMAAGDLCGPCDVAAVVGGADAPGDKVVMLEVRGDEVFVTTTAGIYYSQALFNESGVVCGWTPWKDAARARGFATLALSRILRIVCNNR